MSEKIGNFLIVKRPSKIMKLRKSPFLFQFCTDVNGDWNTKHAIEDYQNYNLIQNEDRWMYVLSLCAKTDFVI